jgi:hypothetical protein
VPDLEDGERVAVRGRSGTYTLERVGTIRSCTCPAWRTQTAPPAQRTCKHLRAYLGEAAERARTGSGPAPIRIAPPPAWVPRVREDREVRQRRRAALAAALETFPVAYDKMLLVYGLRLPRHLAYAMGFWAGLSRAEREEAWAYVGTGPCGIGDWFDEGGLDRAVQPGLDERLHYRFRCDPPEMVTVFGGNSDGSHWGLWYDDPAELPRAICHNWARDSAETGIAQPTLLGTFRDELFGEHREPLDPEFTHVGEILGWLDEVHVKELEAHRNEAIAPFLPRASTCGGTGPWVPGFELPPELGDEYRRHELYRANDPVIEQWIARARDELAAGRPGLALYLGRDLHWQDSDDWREVCTELLVGGFRALGRDAIAEIVRVHHAHRDLASVGVYVDTPASPEEYALKTTDVAALAQAVPAATRARIDDAQLYHAEQIAFWRDRGDTSYVDQRRPHELALALLVERCGVSGTVLEAILRSEPTALHAPAIAAADLAWRSERGRTVLHVACRLGHVEAVRALLERGADPRVADIDGLLPYDAVRDAWEHKRQEAGVIYDLLRARGGAPERKPAPSAAPANTWAVGTRVTHAKFGAGVVTATSGQGDDTKLTIDFAGTSKVLLARFVKRG